MSVDDDDDDDDDGSSTQLLPSDSLGLMRVDWSTSMEDMDRDWSSTSRTGDMMTLNGIRTWTGSVRELGS